MPLDSAQIVTAPIVIEDSCLLGAASVTLPGVTIGHHATLAPLAVAGFGAQIKEKTINMGAPAVVVKVRLSSRLECCKPCLAVHGNAILNFQDIC